MHARSTVSLFAALLAGALSTGCSTLGYLSQASYGQREITLGARPIEKTIADESVPERTRELLAEVPRIKAFGERNGLTPTKSYRTFVDLHRRYVVWVVTACAPLSFQAKVWSFPIVGGVTYLGWFHKRDAEAQVEELRRAGWDADMRGSAAYSTLGWFDDPILSTMLERGQGAVGGLAETVLHESLHASLYVKGQSSFNESVATWFGDRLSDAYLVETRGENAPETQAVRAAEKDGERRAAMLHEGYAALETLYASSKTKEEKLAEKRAIIADLERRVGATRPITNATLIGFRTYHAGNEELMALHHACGDSFPRTLASLRAGVEGAFLKPQEEDVAGVLRRIASRGCAAAPP